MKNPIRWGGVAVILALGSGSNAVAQDASDAFDGQYSYEVGCASCHGRDGEGIYPFGVALKDNNFVTNVPAPVVVQLVKEGRDDAEKSYPDYNGMPAFKGFKHHGEITAIVEYIRGPLQQ